MERIGMVASITGMQPAPPPTTERRRRSSTFRARERRRSSTSRRIKEHQIKQGLFKALMAEAAKAMQQGKWLEAEKLLRNAKATGVAGDVLKIIDHDDDGDEEDGHIGSPSGQEGDSSDEASSEDVRSRIRMPGASHGFQVLDVNACAQRMYGSVGEHFCHDEKVVQLKLAKEDAFRRTVRGKGKMTWHKQFLLATGHKSQQQHEEELDVVDEPTPLLKSANGAQKKQRLPAKARRAAPLVPRAAVSLGPAKKTVYECDAPIEEDDDDDGTSSEDDDASVVSSAALSDVSVFEDEYRELLALHGLVHIPAMSMNIVRQKAAEPAQEPSVVPPSSAAEQAASSSSPSASTGDETAAKDGAPREQQQQGAALWYDADNIMRDISDNGERHRRNVEKLATNILTSQVMMMATRRAGKMSKMKLAGALKLASRRKTRRQSVVSLRGGQDHECKVAPKLVSDVSHAAAHDPPATTATAVAVASVPPLRPCPRTCSRVAPDFIAGPQNFLYNHTISESVSGIEHCPGCGKPLHEHGLLESADISSAMLDEYVRLSVRGVGGGSGERFSHASAPKRPGRVVALDAKLARISLKAPADIPPNAQSRRPFASSSSSGGGGAVEATKPGPDHHHHPPTTPQPLLGPGARSQTKNASSADSGGGVSHKPTTAVVSHQPLSKLHTAEKLMLTQTRQRKTSFVAAPPVISATLLSPTVAHRSASVRKTEAVDRALLVCDTAKKQGAKMRQRLKRRRIREHLKLRRKRRAAAAIQRCFWGYKARLLARTRREGMALAFASVVAPTWTANGVRNELSRQAVRQKFLWRENQLRQNAARTIQHFWHGWYAVGTAGIWHRLYIGKKQQRKHRGKTGAEAWTAWMWLRRNNETAQLRNFWQDGDVLLEKPKPVGGGSTAVTATITTDSLLLSAEELLRDDSNGGGRQAGGAAIIARTSSEIDGADGDPEQQQQQQRRRPTPPPPKSASSKKKQRPKRLRKKRK